MATLDVMVKLKDNDIKRWLFGYAVVYGTSCFTK